MSKQQIDQESAEIQRMVRLLMSTVTMAGLLAANHHANEETVEKAVILTDLLIHRQGGMPQL